MILYHTEQEVLAEIYKVKTLRDAILSTVLINSNPQALHLSDQPMAEFMRFKLPSLVKKGKINKPDKKARMTEALKAHEEIMKQHQALMQKKDKK